MQVSRASTFPASPPLKGGGLVDTDSPDPDSEKNGRSWRMGGPKSGEVVTNTEPLTFMITKESARASTLQSASTPMRVSKDLLNLNLNMSNLLENYDGLM
jgi:hypothetical protein